MIGVPAQLTSFVGRQRELTELTRMLGRARLVTGAVLPIFNHPLKLAGEIGMLDAISGGRLDVGFARAFLPHEFRRFGARRMNRWPASAKASSRSICC